MYIYKNFENNMVEMTVQKTEAALYITDLLSELQSIARVGGLDVLSHDIENILTKHS